MMALSGFKAQNHPQQIKRRGANPTVDDRATPPEMFEPLHKRFRFTIDVATLPHSAKCERYFTPLENGLAQPWARERVWCNPPYSDIRPWVEKAWSEWRLGADAGPELIVMLLPANRTEQKWWQELIEPHRDQPPRFGGPRVEFLPGRPRFVCVDETEVLPNQRPPFGCCLCIWGRLH